MSMMSYINSKLAQAATEGEHNFDPGDYAQCESCTAIDMRMCLECPIASYDKSNNVNKGDGTVHIL